MRGSTHLAGGLLIGALIGPSPVGLAAAGLAALVPDWLQINLPGVNSVIHGVAGHRGFTHWLLTACAVDLAVWLFAPQVALYVMGGWMMHILLDLFSGGTTLLWPVTTVRIRFGEIKTGSRIDIFIGAWLFVMFMLLLARNII